MATLYLALVNDDGPSTIAGTDIPMPMQARDCVRALCPTCGKAHDALWTVRRVMVDTFGHFAVFRLNGERIVPDGSVPHTVDRLPRDARPVDPFRAAAIWHDASGSHAFGAGDPGPRAARCASTYDGAATLRGKAIRCESAAGHDGPHGHSFAARYWTDEA